MSDSPKPNPNVFASSLKATLRRRRPNRLLVGLGTLLILTLLAAVWYWIFTEPPPPTFGILALDAVIKEGEPAEYRAVLLPTDHSEPPYPLHDVHVKAPKAVKPESVQTDAKGHTQLRGKEVLDDSAFFVRLISKDKRKLLEDHATVYVWPADAKVVLVDLETVVRGAEETLQVGAGETLAALEKAGYRIAYFTQRQGDWSEDLPMRAQLRSFQAERALPRGPLYLRAQASDPEALAKDLKGRFAGPLHLIVGAPAWARRCQSLQGVVTLLISQDASDLGAATYPTWEEVAKAFGL